MGQALPVQHGSARSERQALDEGVIKKLEDGLCRGREKNLLEKAARSYKVATGVGCDGFHPKVPLDLSQET